MNITVENGTTLWQNKQLLCLIKKSGLSDAFSKNSRYVNSFKTRWMVIMEQRKGSELPPIKLINKGTIPAYGMKPQIQTVCYFLPLSNSVVRQFCIGHNLPALYFA